MLPTFREGLEQMQDERMEQKGKNVPGFAEQEPACLVA